MLDPDDLPVTFVHMQAIVTSSDGKVLTTSTMGSEGDSSNDDDKPRISPGQGITYLYRYVY